MTTATVRVTLHLPPEARSKSRKVNQYVKAALTVQALQEMASQSITDWQFVRAKLTGGQFAEAETILRAVGTPV